jgi:ribulose-5-phosphate 4-epimerase/fuculose-1-phosphate aldolase
MNNLEMNLGSYLVKAHKIIAKLKMDDLTYTHISGRLEQKDEFLLSPFGIQFADVKPENLLHFNLNGEMKGEKRHFNKTGFSIHSSIYKARNDVNAVIHLHTKETIAVSAMKIGFLPVSQHALHFYESVSFHNYDSLILNPAEEEEALIQDLAQNNVMFLRNHGFITTGKTIWEALFYAYHLQKACEVQVLCGLNQESLIMPLAEVCRKAKKDLLSFEKDLGKRDFDSFNF